MRGAAKTKPNKKVSGSVYFQTDLGFKNVNISRGDRIRFQRARERERFKKNQLKRCRSWTKNMQKYTILQIKVCAACYYFWGTPEGTEKGSVHGFLYFKSRDIYDYTFSVYRPHHTGMPTKNATSTTTVQLLCSLILTNYGHCNG